MDKKEIIQTCEKYKIENYTINDDGSIDVDGNVDLYNKGLTKLPLKFRNVKGSFYCSGNKLTTLEGSPQSVGGSFNCQNNKLTTLEGYPQTVRGYFHCNDNQLNLESYESDYVKSYIKQLNRNKKLNELLNVSDYSY